MKLLDLLNKLRSADETHEVVEWHLDPAEGIDFFLPDRLTNTKLDSREGLEVAVLQNAVLRSAEEQGLAQKNQSGYTIFSEDFVKFESDFYEIFDFPEPYEGAIQVTFNGNTTQGGFAARPALILPDGERVTTYSLMGPFLAIGQSERYRLDLATYEALSALQRHGDLRPELKTEYVNGRLVLDLKNAQRAGAKIDLAHFEKFEVIDPEVIGIHAEYDDDGGLTLSPTFDGVDVGDTESRWGQLNLEDAEALRVKNQLILLRRKL